MDTGYLLQCGTCGTRNRVPHANVAGRRTCGHCGAPLIPSHSLPIPVTDDTWDAEVLDSDAPAVVEVWSPHCDVCAQYELSVCQMASSLYGKARVLQLEAEQNLRTAQRYGIKGVPTVLLFRAGQVVATLVGPQGERGLREKLGL
ncbi:MAG: thioredoxin [Deltaproteobacteria bacterium]|nr:thioredoxin [Deltaproteobacteria bacterium]